MPDTDRPPTITRNGVVRLLALSAGADQRTVAEEDVTLWLAIAQQERWTEPAAQRVIVDHYASGADRQRITPAAITDRLRLLRGKAAESFEAPRIPDELPAAEYPAWLRARLAEHVDGVLGRWAVTGGPVPEGKPIEAGTRVSGLAELVAAAPPEHREQLAAGVRAVGRGGEPAPRSGRPGASRDPQQRAAARAELDAVRPQSESGAER